MLLAAGVMLAALSACATGPRAGATDAADTTPGGVPLSGGIGTSGLCATLPQARVPASCAGI
ncbi:MAG TPA: hypothetical protein PKA20_16550 [Burkholderiaceae bacterium]|nr:hypothetical protein [Burkholderiaceae bacterium]